MLVDAKHHWLIECSKHSSEKLWRKCFNIVHVTISIDITQLDIKSHSVDLCWKTVLDSLCLDNVLRKRMFRPLSQETAFYQTILCRFSHCLDWQTFESQCLSTLLLILASLNWVVFVPFLPCPLPPHFLSLPNLSSSLIFSLPCCIQPFSQSSSFIQCFSCCKAYSCNIFNVPG